MNFGSLVDITFLTEELLRYRGSWVVPGSGPELQTDLEQGAGKAVV
jgi:hypothetical protein